MDMIGQAASLGVGAFLAVLIFIMYRADRKSSETRFEKLCEHHNKKWEAVVRADQATRHENTKALTQLTAALDRINTNGKTPH
jgi:hypothetical protein